MSSRRSGLWPNSSSRTRASYFRFPDRKNGEVSEQAIAPGEPQRSRHVASVCVWVHAAGSKGDPIAHGGELGDVVAQLVTVLTTLMRVGKTNSSSYNASQ